MNTVEDNRIKRTKNALKEALLEMLETEPIDKIRVHKLCMKAEINKTTFYNHYHDIYDFYEEILDDFFKETVDKIPDYNLL